jgi:hypothetical protein
MRRRIDVQGSNLVTMRMFSSPVPAGSRFALR